ncbi:MULTISPECIES: flagellar motor protein MotB [unclassified Paracoccus (in: a-proteobacteria)]|uniref:flagellar motor protein MotB n=1 Tax=unclassified Paracoccus (in: a-proteobacteria) TaxID=2688777 RepID=UPI0012B197EF|nr:MULTISPECIES: flagellar motor protein MotB [unclassified Paracoccus (in: a-proteobacteria)]UXU75844.1 OmpA family protein [Paracoccus sp. SMMA_5]UXU81753.1 OmpA family protein [Paracoccus sp. SMMA_5_TC]
MAATGGSGPIIIKRVQGAQGGGHHGGAWKVAYADFVTAMMAFFLLMWLLNATTEKQRQGLAEYFNPTIVQRTGSGSDGPYGGLKQDATTDSGQGAGASRDSLAGQALRQQDAAFEQLARHIQNQLTGSGAESLQKVNLLRHVVTRMTDEGLVIELTDLVDAPLFDGDSAQPTAALRDLAAILSQVLGRVRNDIAIGGHVRAYPEMLIQSPVWALSDARAHAVRNLMQDAGFDMTRVQRVTAHADRRNRSVNPMDPGNNRIEIILLR